MPVLKVSRDIFVMSHLVTVTHVQTEAPVVRMLKRTKACFANVLLATPGLGVRSQDVAEPTVLEVFVG